MGFSPRQQAYSHLWVFPSQREKQGLVELLIFCCEIRHKKAIAFVCGFAIKNAVFTPERKIQASVNTPKDRIAHGWAAWNRWKSNALILEDLCRRTGATTSRVKPKRQVKFQRQSSVDFLRLWPNDTGGFWRSVLRLRLVLALDEVETELRTRHTKRQQDSQFLTHMLLTVHDTRKIGTCISSVVFFVVQVQTVRT